MTKSSHLSEDISKSTDSLSGLKEQIKTLLDLSESECTVFMHLLQNNELTATEIAKATGIQRTRTYEIFRQLREKELIELTSENPQKYAIVSPRLAFDNWLLKSQQRLETKKSMLMDVLPSIQEIWNEQHENLITKRLSLISETLVKEIIPQEIRSAKQAIFLALKDSPKRDKGVGSHAGRLFDPFMFNTGIQGLLKRGVKLFILIGNIDNFIQNAHPVLLKTLINGLLDGIIEVRSLNIHLPQSFLLVDSERLYLFFFDETQGGVREALRTERRSLTEFFNLIWQNFWDNSSEIELDNVVNKLKDEKFREK
ncbi:MAG: TrmB family transcriptional regulator [Candidatus Hodarchaeales archaeon]|jgi:hypothetical protein